MLEDLEGVAALDAKSLVDAILEEGIVEDNVKAKDLGTENE